MRKDWVLTQEAFDALLLWLSPDREQAAAEYEKIRAALIKLFDYRGVEDSDRLADETLNRVADRLARPDENDKILKKQFVYGVARKVHLEYLSGVKTVSLDSTENDVSGLLPVAAPPEENEEEECMKRCLNELEKDDSALIFSYYGVDRQTKTAEREQLRKTHDISMKALRVKVFRIRQQLQKCLKNCRTKKSL